MALLCAFQLWLSHRTTQRVASHAWRVLQANLALSKNPQAAHLALKQEETAKAEADATAALNGNGHALSPSMRQRMFHEG